MRRIGAVLVTAVALLGLAATPAASSTPGVEVAGITIGAPLSAMSAAQCAPAGQRRLCVWKNQNQTGAPDYYWTIPTGSNPPGWCINFGSAINDQIRSVYLSPGPRSATLKEHAGCTGNANTFVDQTYPNAHCWQTFNWWPSCSAGGNQASSAWVLKV